VVSAKNFSSINYKQRCLLLPPKQHQNFIEDVETAERDGQINFSCTVQCPARQRKEGEFQQEQPGFMQSSGRFWRKKGSPHYGKQDRTTQSKQKFEERIVTSFEAPESENKQDAEFEQKTKSNID